jgi:cytochrome P450 family 4
VPHRVANPWLLFSWIYKLTETASEELDQKKRLDEFTRKIINKRREAKKSGEIVEKTSLLDFMLEISDTHPNFTEDDIVDEVCTFMLAVGFLSLSL